MAFSNLLYLPPLGPDSPSSPPLFPSDSIRTYAHTHARSYKLLPRYYTCPSPVEPGELLLNLIHGWEPADG